MKMFASFLLVVFGLIVSLVGTILAMIKGWGLEPKSWFWIIIMYLFMQVFALIIVECARKIGK